ncbi:MAG: glycerate 2-kinase [Gemmatimonadales bacterium]|nr:glycerate 2-kinase [Gemmatimonadales bacterium]
MRPNPLPPSRILLADLYAAATAAAAPGPALTARLDRLDLDPGRRVWILALGKASMPMAQAATDCLRSRGRAPAGGLVVAPAASASPHPLLRCVAGDHPEPGPGSFAAADALAAVAAQVTPADEVWVLLSGGTTSLIGAPEPGLSADDLTRLYSLLLGSGLDITAMNRIRKRFSRWGGGKLARALAPARVRVYIVSDVIGDDLASIGSGPLVPDPTTAAEVRDLLQRADLWSRLPESARGLVASVEAGKTAETPKPGDQAFASVTLELIVSNRLALEAAARRATELGLAAELVEKPIAGEASVTGASVAAKLLNNCARKSEPQPSCTIWGGETTVTLGPGPAGLGGRCQELALAAARALEGAPEGTALLAAGTDGRDGPTDAAGAIVDGSTWSAIVRSGRDPTRDLATHDAYHALDAAGVLLRPGLTGTNVMDIVIGVCGFTDESATGAESHRRG